MQRPSLPTHPSLPRPPHTTELPASNDRSMTNAATAGNAGYYANATLAPSHYQAAYSSHYAQALHHAQYAQTSAANYYAPGPYSGNYPMSGPLRQNGPQNTMPTLSSFTSGIPTNSSSWYTPGNCRCTYKNCNFVGSAKSLETHRMDRHLIYPPGWKEQKRKPDWDADPSLIGQRLPVQGTNVVLDTPEAIDDWIAERKKRWPSVQRVEDKKQKLEEAAARGQLDVLPSGFGGRKRKRPEVDGGTGGEHGRGMGRGRGRGRGRAQFGGGARGAGRGRGGSWGSTHATANGVGESGEQFPNQSNPSHAPMWALPAKPHVRESATLRPSIANTGYVSSNESEEDDSAPEVTSSKPTVNTAFEDLPSDVDVPKAENLPTGQSSNLRASPISTVDPKAAAHPVQRPRPPQPRRPMPNPFAPRGSLLRNLLLPEIRMTISNLSQAIRFLVDNDFLQEVELRPGQANEQMIEVLDDSPKGPVPKMSIT